MLTHRWRTLGLQYPSSRNRDDPTFQHVKSQEEVKNDCPLKISAIQTGHTVAQRDRKENKKRMKGSLYCSSNISAVGFSEVKVSETDSPRNTAASLDSNSDDSDLSDQEKESVQVSKWAASMEQDLRPESFDEDLDALFSTETEAGQLYAEVLPAPLKDLDCTQRPSSAEYKEIQQRLTSDPCLAPMVARLLELERLQAATVQKERGKQVRSRPATAVAPAQNQNLIRLRNGDLPGSKFGLSGHAECNSVTCSFTKLVLCPNSLCRNRHHPCPLTKPGHVSRDGCLRHFLPKCPEIPPGKFNKTENVAPDSSLSVSPKPTTSSRTKRPRTTKKSTKPQRVDSSSAKKTMTTPSRKTWCKWDFIPVCHLVTAVFSIVSGQNDASYCLLV